MRFKTFVTKRLPGVVKSLSNLGRTILALVLVLALSGIYWHNHTSQANLQQTNGGSQGTLSVGVAPSQSPLMLYNATSTPNSSSSGPKTTSPAYNSSSAVRSNSASTENPMPVKENCGSEGCTKTSCADLNSAGDVSILISGENLAQSIDLTNQDLYPNQRNYFYNQEVTAAYSNYVAYVVGFGCTATVVTPTPLEPSSLTIPTN